MSSTPTPAGPKESRVDQVIVICSIMLALSSLTTIARLWIRLALLKTKLGAEDWFILVSAIFAAAEASDIIVQTQFGLGQHIYDLPPDTKFTVSLQLYYAGQAIYYIAVATTKISILFFYLRLITGKTYRLLVWLCMGFITCTMVSCTIAGIFQCKPVAFAWDKTIEGSCFNAVALFYSNAGLNLLQDFMVYVLPMKMIYHVQIPKRQKIALAIVFTVGGFVCITGMIRLNKLQLASVSKDVTWDNFDSAVWSAIESNTGVVCASLPHFKPLIIRYFPSLMGVRSITRGTPIPDGPNSTGSNQSKRKRPYFGTEVELEHGADWEDSHIGNRNDGPTYTVRVGPNDSREHLRDDGEQTGNPGIYKHTNFVISRSHPSIETEV